MPANHMPCSPAIPHAPIRRQNRSATVACHRINQLCGLAVMVIISHIAAAASNVVHCARSAMERSSQNGYMTVLAFQVSRNRRSDHP